MSNPVNPATWASFNLSLRNKQFDEVMRLFLSQLSQFCVQGQQELGSAGYLASVLNGSGALAPSALSQLGINSSETANRTINAAGYNILALILNVTAAINYTLTIQNLASGSIVLLRIYNGTGATRTFTVSATGYGSVYLSGPSTLRLDAGASSTSGTVWSGIGTSVGNELLLVGSVGS